MELPKPAPELKNLEYFAGTWTWEGDIKPGPEDPGGKMTMIEHNSWMDGGFFLTLRSEFETPAVGKGTGIAYMGFDRARNVYTYDEFNSIGEAQHSIGTIEGDTWTWLGEQHIGSQTTRTRLIMKMLTATRFAFRFETSPDGNNWSTVMDGKATTKE